MKAIIKWISKCDGGRTTIPFGDKYAPIIVLKNEKLNLEKENWSLLVNNKKKISENETIANVCFLSESAPIKLFSGTEFSLYEGKKLVAHGLIL